MSSFLSDGTEPISRSHTPSVPMTSAILQQALPFLEYTSDAFFAYDRQWRYLYINAQAETLLGQERAHLLGKCLWDLYPEQIGTVQHALYQRAMQSSTSLRDEYLDHATNRWYEARFLPFADGLIIYLDDITARKQAEIHRETDSALDIITRFDRGLRHLYVNPAITTATGMLPQDIIGKTNEELGMPAEPLTRWNATLASVFATGEPQSIEFDFSTPEGEARFYQSRVTAERDAHGQIISALAITRDVSELKKAEEALRQGERRYRIMGETVPYGLWMCNAAGQLDYISQSFLELVGMTLEECLERGWFHLLAPEAVAPIREKSSADYGVSCVQRNWHQTRSAVRSPRQLYGSHALYAN